MENLIYSGLSEVSFWFVVGGEDYHVQFKSFPDKWIVYVLHSQTSNFEQCLGAVDASFENINVSYARDTLSYFLNHRPSLDLAT